MVRDQVEHVSINCSVELDQKTKALEQIDYRIVSDQNLNGVRQIILDNGKDTVIILH